MPASVIIVRRCLAWTAGLCVGGVLSQGDVEDRFNGLNGLEEDDMGDVIAMERTRTRTAFKCSTLIHAI